MRTRVALAALALAALAAVPVTAGAGAPLVAMGGPPAQAPAVPADASVQAVGGPDSGDLLGNALLAVGPALLASEAAAHPDRHYFDLGIQPGQPFSVGYEDGRFFAHAGQVLIPSVPHPTLGWPKGQPPGAPFVTNPDVCHTSNIDESPFNRWSNECTGELSNNQGIPLSLQIDGAFVAASMAGDAYTNATDTTTHYITLHCHFNNGGGVAGVFIVPFGSGYCDPLDHVGTWTTSDTWELTGWINEAILGDTWHVIY